MTMALYDHLPPEFRAAKETLQATRSEVLPKKRDWWARMIGNALLFIGGCAVSITLFSLGVVTISDKEFWRSALTAISILSGFMVATMVFTGKIEAAKSLNLAELRDVAGKSSYLLLYQIATLANHLVCLPLLLITPAVAAISQNTGMAIGIVALGLFFVSIARSLLIPVQILELHRFTHKALLREKRDEASKVDQM